MPRCFIAVDVPNDVKNKIILIQEMLLKYGKFTFPSKENIHMTLRFLGDVDDVKGISSALEEVSMNQFRVNAEHIGVFPTLDKIRVIWAGITDNGSSSVLSEKINGALDIREDKQYAPHLTIARVKYYDKTGLLKILDEYKNYKLGSFTVDKFTLYESMLTNEGPIYKEIKTFALL